MFLWEKTKQARKISHSNKQKKDGLFLFRNQYSIFPLCHQSCLNETTISCSSFKMQEFNYAMMIIYIYCIVLGILYLCISVCSRYFENLTKLLRLYAQRKGHCLIDLNMLSGARRGTSTFPIDFGIEL